MDISEFSHRRQNKQSIFRGVQSKLTDNYQSLRYNGLCYYLQERNLMCTQNHLTLSDRIAIEAGIFATHTFSEIAKQIGKSSSTVSREIRSNRTLVMGERPRGKDCSYASHCAVKELCDEEYCPFRCSLCREKDCRTMCERYHKIHCNKSDKPPYVCNICNERRKCTIDKAFYSAIQADAMSKRRLSESRQGIQTEGEDLQTLNRIVSSLVRKGQPLTHICAEHGNELPVSQRTLYNYIDAGVLSIKNIDLRRKTGYRPRKKKCEPSLGFANLEFRKGRKYSDFQTYKVKHPDVPIVEMDTVRGVREQGKRMLTMIFCESNLMLCFLMKDGKAESVIDVFDFLTSLLGLEMFRRLFPLILTDNGSEFKFVDDLEKTRTGENRTKIFYCDPQASWQKPHIEKNHQYIRYVLPKGKSFNKYTQSDISLLCNHINSTRRAGLNNRSPFELANSDMKYMMELLDMHIIPSDEVHLNPDLLG